MARYDEHAAKPEAERREVKGKGMVTALGQYNVRAAVRLVDDVPMLGQSVRALPPRQHAP